MIRRRDPHPRYEADAGLHFEETGETAWGTKWVIAAVRSPEIHGRVILDVHGVPTPGGEAATAMNCFTHLARAGRPNWNLLNTTDPAQIR